MADPVFLITGASSGIGAATARQAAEAGYRLVLAARSTDKLEALADELGGASARSPCAATSPTSASRRRWSRRPLHAFGRLDVVFANAGFGAKRGFLEETPEHWRDMVLTNVLGCALTIRATLPALKQSTGHLLLTSSVAGRRALPGSLYCATKHAVTAMAESLARSSTTPACASPRSSRGWSTRRSSTTRSRRAGARRHRPRGDLRRRAAGPRRRQRDPHPAGEPAALSARPAGVCDPRPMGEQTSRAQHPRSMAGPGRVPLRERLLVEWVAQAAVGDPFPEPWSNAYDPLRSIIRTLVVLGVIELPPPDAKPADVAREAGVAARAWLERNPPPA